MNSQLNVPKIIVDTDPGGDDSFALLWLQSLAKQGLADIVAVTAAAGNVSAKRTFQGASRLLQLGGFDAVEVGRGVCRELEGIGDAAYIHGLDGMGNLCQTLPASPRSFDTARSSDDILIEKLQAMPGEITLVAIAPLTNLASAEKKSPGILKRAKEIVIMGGAFHTPGNVTSESEFNIAFDPEAAQTVFASRNDLIIIPLDVTHQLIFTPTMAAQLHRPQTKRPFTPRQSQLAQFITTLCDFMTQTALAYRETQGLPGFLVHDAATLAYVFYPETLAFCRARVNVETQGIWTRGKTLIDSRHRAKSSANAWVASTVECASVLAIMLEDLKHLVQTIE
ncbi:nucleoside hydrolase [Myxacorys almedinensis]|uniref:Nucleoside hydrolase n=1 Tax=Myxacorys almedinensis A TaxID=2690445 RepID=A0A8J7YX02_9CYAN|nr:nucleoside hydrolase [Myxacorys almedinensis]NDJ16177.1 nucleoside hydrolase [Myxacorys almedinensis A]